MSFLLWLLLPVAAASGWWFARRSFLSAPPISQNISPEYFKGLNYLLNEQPNKAIEVFSRLLKSEHSEEVETHIAVGVLFRRRGEVDQAIRIHQDILSRSDIDEKQRRLVLLELGRDYLRAGLLDRAEGLLHDLIRVEPVNVSALDLLKTIYEQEKEWLKAAEVVNVLAASESENYQPVLAQYACEMAVIANQKRDFNRAQGYIDKALHSDPLCVRASILKAQGLAENGAFEKAVSAYQRVADQDPDYLSEVIDPMLECYYQLDRLDDMQDYLQGLLRQYACTRAVLALSELLRQHRGDHDAAIYMANYLGRTPSLAGLHRLVDLNLAESKGELRDTFRVIRKTLMGMIKTQPLYQCRQCGFSGKLLHWLCPSCKSWNRVKPVESLGFE